MAKYLDLDTVLPPSRTIKLGGQEYEVATLSVSQFIDMVRRTEELQKRADAGKPLSMAEVIELQRDGVKEALPTMPAEVLNKLTYKQIEAVLEFVRATAEAEAPKPEGEGSSGNVTAVTAS
jgi:hypothetical protein